MRNMVFLLSFHTKGTEPLVEQTCEQSEYKRKKRLWLEIAMDVNARKELSMFGAKDLVLERSTQLSDTIDRLEAKLPVNSSFRDRLLNQSIPQLGSGIKYLIYLMVAIRPDFLGLAISQVAFLESAIEEIYGTVNGLKKSLVNDLTKDMFAICNFFECNEFQE